MDDEKDQEIRDLRKLAQAAIATGERLNDKYEYAVTMIAKITKQDAERVKEMIAREVGRRDSG